MAQAKKYQAVNQGSESFEEISANKLIQIIERIERLEEEKNNISEDIREVYGESKSEGFDNKVVRQLIKLRKMDKMEVEEQEELLELYKRAVGM